MIREDKITIERSSIFREIFISLLGFLLARVILWNTIDFFGLSYLMALYFHFKVLKILPFSLVILGYLSTGTISPLFLPFLGYILLQSLSSHLHPRRTFFLMNVFALLLYSLRTMPSLNSFSILFALFALYSLFSHIFLMALEALFSLKDGHKSKETHMLSLSLLLLLPLLSLRGVEYGGIYLDAFFIKIILFFFSLYGGASLGAMVGTLWAISTYLIPTSSLDPIFYPLLGLLCGLFKDLKELGLGIGFLLASLGIALISGGEWIFATHLLEGLLSLLLFFIFETTYPLSLNRGKIRGGVEDEEKRLDGETRNRKRLEEYGDSLMELGGVLFYFNKEITLKEEGFPDRMLQNLVREVCTTCQFLALCSGDALFYQGLLIPLLSYARKGSPFPRSFMDERLKDCPYPHKVRNFMERYLREMEPGERKEELLLIKEILSSLVRGLGEGVKDLREEDRIASNVLEYGLASSSHEEVSGDSYLIERLSGGREMFGLSDGLGTGKEAARKSGHVLDLAGRLLSLGVKEEEALHILNLLCLLSYRDEEYTTLDLAIFSPMSARVTFHKYGAASTFIKRGIQVSSICSRSLPLGVYATRGRSIQRKLCKEDQVILITDGILEVSREDTVKEEWLLHVLKEISHQSPKELAALILKKAKERASSPFDDMTVMVIQRKRRG